MFLIHHLRLILSFLIRLARLAHRAHRFRLRQDLHGIQESSNCRKLGPKMQRCFWRLRQGKAICESLQQNAMISDMRVRCGSYLQVSFSEHAPRSVSLAHRSAPTLLSTTLNDPSAIIVITTAFASLSFQLCFLCPCHHKCQKVFLLVSHQTMSESKQKSGDNNTPANLLRVKSDKVSEQL